MISEFRAEQEVLIYTIFTQVQKNRDIEPSLPKHQNLER